MINFTLLQNSTAQIALYDIAGRKLKELPQEKLNADAYTRSIKLNDLSAGNYIVRISFDNYSFAKILVVR